MPPSLQTHRGGNYSDTGGKALDTAELNVPKELLDHLVKGPMTQGDLESMFRSLKKAVIERAMSAEMSDHLGYRQGEDKPEGQSNLRNGTSGKTVITDDGPLRIEVPRDREGSFEPQIIGKHERRFTGFDQKIIAMYACIDPLIFCSGVILTGDTPEQVFTGSPQPLHNIPRPNRA